MAIDNYRVIQTTCLQVIVSKKRDLLQRPYLLKRAMRRRMTEAKGQMAMELLVVMPVVLVLAVIAIDMMVYLGDCARFDRVSSQHVLVHAASPSAVEYDASTMVSLMEADIIHSMDSVGRCEVAVSAGGGVFSTGSEAGSLLSFVPQPQIFICTLSCVPWPFQNTLFGFTPPSFTHTRKYVVDPYRSGVVL
jgi:hypothetical protein